MEFGAPNGGELSSTLLLESAFGWKGILAELATIWHSERRRSRCCCIDHRCVWSESGRTLQFSEVDSSPMLSSIDAFAEGDMHAVAGQGQRIRS